MRSVIKFLHFQGKSPSDILDEMKNTNMKNTYGDKTRTEPAPKKAKMSRSAVKVMLTVFWDAEGIIMADYLPTGRTMNSEYYSGLIKSLKIELSKKRRNKLRNGPVFLILILIL